MSNEKTALNRLEHIAANWYISDPIMLNIWSKVEKIPDTQVKTIAIDTRSLPAQVRFNVNFINILSIEILEMIMASETFKLFLKHATSRSQNPKNVTYFASQIAVDEILKSNEAKIPEFKNYFLKAKDLDLPEDSYMEDYKRRLLENQDEIEKILNETFGKKEMDFKKVLSKLIKELQKKTEQNKKSKKEESKQKPNQQKDENQSSGNSDDEMELDGEFETEPDENSQDGMKSNSTQSGNQESSESGSGENSESNPSEQSNETNESGNSNGSNGSGEKTESSQSSESNPSEQSNGESSEQKEDVWDGSKFKDYKDQNEALKDYLDPRSGGGNMWGDNDILDAEIKHEVDMYKGSSNMWGKFSGNHIGKIIAAHNPKISVREWLRRFYTSIKSSKQYSTRMKPNRRFDLDVQGKRYKEMTKILFAIDSSGSMSDDDLAEGFAVVNSACKDALIHYMLWDCSIQLVETKFKKAKSEFKIAGRGGTDPQAVLNYAEKHKYDGVVIYSDMYFDGNLRQPKGTKILWMGTNKSSKNPTNFGMFCTLDRTVR